MTKAKLKKVIGYSVHDDKAKIYSGAPPAGIWVIRVFAEHYDYRVEIEYENQEPCALGSIIDLALSGLHECLTELTPVTDGGYTIYLKA